MSRGHSKGSAYERLMAEELSLWWTQDLEEPRTDIFWRTAGSGARATVRGRKGKTTKNHSGDILASDPIGQPFLDYVCLELKRGYSSSTIFDVLDKSPGAATQTFEKWITQAEESAKNAGSMGWLIIHKRDRRETMVFFPDRVYDVRIYGEWPVAHFNILNDTIYCMTLQCFLACVYPNDVKDYLARSAVQDK